MSANEMLKQALEYKKQGDFQKALECFHKALNIDSTEKAALLSMGLDSEDLGDIQKALDYYQKALQLNSEDRDANKKNE